MAVDGIPGLLRWAPFMSFKAGERFAAPNGDIVTANIDFTAGATYSAANVTPSTQDERIEALEVLGGITPGNTSDAAVSSLINSATDTRNALDARYVNEGTPVSNTEIAGLVTGAGATQSALDARYVNEGTPVSNTEIAGLVTGAGSTQTALDNRFLRKGQLYLDAKVDFLAVGDGVADDTAALQAWLDAGGERLVGGAFRITAGLTVPGSNRRIVTENAKIVADSVGITMLTAAGDNLDIRVTLDGNNKANYGIRATGAGPTITQSKIENIYSATTTARAIECTTTGGVIITRNAINNVNAVGDATLGNANGASRAIVLTSTSAATKKSTIADNVIDTIIGEEGDAIQVLFTGAGSIYPEAKASVTGNKISNVSRRFIKIQGSGCKVQNNELSHDGIVSSYPGNAIDIIQSESTLVKNNIIDAHPLGVSINIVGVAGNLLKNVVCQGNIIRQDDAKAYVSIFANYLTASTFKDNTIHGGTNAISIGNSTNIGIKGNEHFGGASASVSFTANATNTDVRMRNNDNFNTARTTVVSNTSVGALSSDNY